MNALPQVVFLPQVGYELDTVCRKIELIFSQFEASLPPAGSKVLLKPNLVKAAKRSDAAQTDPEFVRAVILCGRKRGWNISVGDSPAIGSARQVGNASGLTKVCDELQTPLLTLEGSISVSIENRPTTIAASLQNFDAIINLPKLKGHGQLYFTAAVKNLYGCVAGKVKIVRHVAMGDKEGGRIFARMLLDTAELVKPCLTIVDGIDAMAGRGPLNGKCVQENLIAAATDSIALDWALVQHLGGDITQDPILNLVSEEARYQNHCHSELVTPFGLPKRGAFYFPSKEERKPISFHPWILLRFAFRNLKSKFAS